MVQGAIKYGMLFIFKILLSKEWNGMDRFPKILGLTLKPSKKHASLLPQFVQFLLKTEKFYNIFSVSTN